MNEREKAEKPKYRRRNVGLAALLLKFGVRPAKKKVLELHPGGRGTNEETTHWIAGGGFPSPFERKGKEEGGEPRSKQKGCGLFGKQRVPGGGVRVPA